MNNFQETALRLMQVLKLDKDKEVAQALGLSARGGPAARRATRFPRKPCSRWPRAAPISSST